ncbi:MAG: hypothetical protein WA840_08050 [Caulobacteraceae bacterium]
MQHIRHTDLVHDPVRVVNDLHAGFGMELKPVVKRRPLELVARKPRGGYGDDVYRFEDHDLDPEAERHRYRAYFDAFGVEAEVSAGSAAKTAWKMAMPSQTTALPAE